MSRRTAIDEVQFFNDLPTDVLPHVRAFARRVIEHAPAHGLKVQWESASFVLKLPDKRIRNGFSFGAIKSDGRVWIGWLTGQCERVGIRAKIGRTYIETVARLLGASTGGGGGFEGVMVEGRGRKRRSYPKLESLLPVEREWFAAIDRAVSEIRIPEGA